MDEPAPLLLERRGPLGGDGGGETTVRLRVPGKLFPAGDHPAHGQMLPNPHGCAADDPWWSTGRCVRACMKHKLVSCIANLERFEGPTLALCGKTLWENPKKNLSCTAEFSVN